MIREPTSLTYRCIVVSEEGYGGERRDLRELGGLWAPPQRILDSNDAMDEPAPPPG